MVCRYLPEAGVRDFGALGCETVLPERVEGDRPRGLGVGVQRPRPAQEGGVVAEAFLVEHRVHVVAAWLLWTRTRQSHKGWWLQLE